MENFTKFMQDPINREILDDLIDLIKEEDVYQSIMDDLLDYSPDASYTQEQVTNFFLNIPYIDSQVNQKSELPKTKEFIITSSPRTTIESAGTWLEEEIQILQQDDNKIIDADVKGCGSYIGIIRYSTII